jgi:hypothetical protein
MALGMTDITTFLTQGHMKSLSYNGLGYYTSTTRVKKGCGQRKTKRDRAGHAKHLATISRVSVRTNSISTRNSKSF